jgi:hypothetical protein
VSCTLVQRRRPRLTCTVSFPAAAHDRSASLLVAVAHSRRVVALGHARLRRGTATVTMRPLRAPASGTVQVTLVVTRRGAAPRTLTVAGAVTARS